MRLKEGMKKFSRVLSRWLFIFLLLGMSLAIFKAASAQTELIWIDQPPGSLSGTVTINGRVATQTSWIGLYIFDTSVGPVLTDALCGLTTFPYYQCQWDTTQAPNGSHTIKSAIKGSDGIISYSTGVSVTVSNGGVVILPITPEPGKTIKPTPTSTPVPSPSMTETSQPIAGRPDLSPIPAAAPASTPPPTLVPTAQELIANSQVITTIVYQIDLDKPLHLAKLESRQTTSQQKFLLFTGKSFPESYLKITIQSQPLVMTAKSDSSGGWQYVLEKPLEPGDHQVFVEVNNNGQVVQSGPYPFTIARAQATSDNPLGTSLTLVDPQREMLKNYLYLAGGVILLALLVMLLILYFRKLKKMRNANPPIKEPSAI